FVTDHGLSTMLPSDGLVSNLQRGPTPATPSYTITRKYINIVKATAGANADSAFASYDDNETTDWVNDGQLATAWIEYELERPATISEVEMKLNNFRSRSYPIRITVDGKEVFNDSTKKSLGYFTAVCKPTLGKKIRIELTKESIGNNNNGVEVAGKKLDDGVARDDSKAKGTLSIIEVEMYEKL
ncbi:MAG TPA: discoidin domain-containing protein, partial [Mucilaginibacter sp.]